MIDPSDKLRAALNIDMPDCNKDLSDIYIGIREGKQYIPARTLSDMYREVINETGAQHHVMKNYAKFEKQAAELEASELYNIPGIDEVTIQKILAARKHLVAHWIQNQCGYTDANFEISTMVTGYLENWVDWTKLSKYIQSKAKDRNKLEGHFKGEQGHVNIKDMVAKELMAIGKDPNNTQLLNNTYVSLFSYAFPESTVSVGKGELILTLFTNAVKGSVGDLEYGGISSPTLQVEVKVGKGRAVSARGGMFKNANVALEDAVSGTGSTKSNKDFTRFLYEGEHSADRQLPKLSPFSRARSHILELLNKYDPNGTNLKIRHEVTLASLVWAYANPEDKDKGFSHLLLIYQAGKKASTAKNMDPEKGQFPYGTPIEGTLEEAWYLDCSSMSNIYDAMREGKLMLERGGEQEGGKKLQGDGVYMLYAGSNTEIGYQGVASTLRARLTPEQQKIFDMGFNAGTTNNGNT